jgi:hypothetical protein
MIKRKVIKLGAQFNIAIFLLAMAVPIMAVAQFTDISQLSVTSSESAPNTMVAGLNNTGINQQKEIEAQINSDNIKYADIYKTIDDYLSGKTKDFSIPNTTPYVEPVHKNVLSPIINHAPVPSIETISLTQDSGQWLPLEQHDGGNWANTYAIFGLNGNNASAVDGQVSCINNLEDLGKEEFVMHYMGKDSNGIVDKENCIQIQRSLNEGIFYFMVNGDWINRYNAVRFPAGDTFFMYIKAYNPSGQYFNQIEFYVLDLTTRQYYRNVSTSSVTQKMYRPDMTLEKSYEVNEPRPGITGVWKWVSNFHVYNSMQQRVDLLNNGMIYELLPPTVSNPYVLNANYTDFTYYVDTQNAQGTLYMTRYGPGTPKPTHP